MYTDCTFVLWVKYNETRTGLFKTFQRFNILRERAAYDFKLDKVILLRRAKCNSEIKQISGIETSVQNHFLIIFCFERGKSEGIQRDPKGIGSEIKNKLDRIESYALGLENPTA